jgi:hypothetical protein
MSSNNLDLFRMLDRAKEGAARRDKGIATVTAAQRAEWSASYVALAERFLSNLPLGGEFSGETLRLFCKSNGLVEPTHPNAWSALARTVITRWRKSKRIAVVGFAHAHDPRSHACSMPRYRKEGT